MLNHVLDISKERYDLYLTLKAASDVLASIMVDDDEAVALRIRAVNALAGLMKTMRLYLQDEEDMQSLQRDVAALKLEVANRLNRSRNGSTR